MKGIAFNGEYRVSIIQDEHPESPREWDNLSQMCFIYTSWHNKEIQGEDGFGYASVDDLIQKLAEELFTPLDIIEYGKNIETEIEEVDFGDFWKSSTDHMAHEMSFQLEEEVRAQNIIESFSIDQNWEGIAFISRNRIIEEYGDDSAESYEKARQCVMAEIKTYQQYIEMDVWGFVIEEKCPCCEQYGYTDSCWGFYGADPRENGMLQHTDEKFHELMIEAYLDL